MFEKADLCAQVEDLLERERKAIVAGDFERLERMLVEKRRLMERVRSSRLRREHLPRLRRKAERNRRLLIAAGEGIRAAATIIVPAAPPQNGLQTYDARGRSHDLTAPRPGCQARL